MWAQICHGDERVISNLRYVIQKTITNQVTTKMIRELVPHVVTGNIDSWQFTPDDNEYYTFLLTPNAVGTAHLAIRYSTSFNFKIVKRIIVYYCEMVGEYYRALELGERTHETYSGGQPGPQPAPQPGGQRGGQ